MNREIVAAILLSGVLVLLGCGTTEDVPRREKVAAAPISLPSTTTIQNYSDVEAVLESAEIINDPQFSMRLFIVSVTAAAGSSAVIEAGQRVVATPLYDMDAGGVVDLTLPKNKALHAVLSLTPGSKFTGTLAVTKKGNWQLLSANEK